MSDPNVQTLVLDAHPLITQHYSTLSRFAQAFYTTPTIFNEIRDENARKNLALWGENLKIRHPKPESIKRVTDFARLTGDYQVLSVNDLHIIALTYELEVELNNGDWRLRKYPGEKKPHQLKYEQKMKEESEAKGINPGEDVIPVKKGRCRGGKKVRARREAALQAELEKEGQAEPQPVESQETVSDSNEFRETGEKLEILEIKDQNKDESLPNIELLKLQDQDTAETPSQEESAKTTEEEVREGNELKQDYDEEDDDGDWITPDNLMEEMIKESGQNIEKQSSSNIKVALATQDFAVQNTSLQLGLNLMNILSGLRIKRIRNYMLRCHACFAMIPIPKDGRPKHFCPKCGGNTLLRCAVSIDSTTGEIKPHLKANFEWRRRGDRYSLASPLSKNSQKRFGNKGFVHNKSNKQKEYEEPILREDQKEYQKALKDDDWLRRQNEKVLNDYIGGGSADNFISPFVAQSYRTNGVKVGKGRFVNSARRKK